LTMAQVAQRAGVAERTLYRVQSSTTITRITERAILAVTP
jgi:DNA-binding phage protein